MKPYYLFIILFYSSCWSQKWPSDEFAKRHNYIEIIGDTIGTNQKPEKMKFAMYPDGKEGILSLIKTKFKYPDTWERPKNNGRILLKYVVNKKGRIEEIEVLESAGKPFDDEAISVLKKMELWIPGVKDGDRCGSLIVSRLC